jgi:cytochrome bd ubiquinol oxidase subunit II
MNLQTLWFILIAVLYTGYFILEGFDLGVGILLPFLGKKDDARRRMIINTIGPHWDGNEVWLIVAGGATFAAFPDWYATLFSGFYLPLFLMLIALIFRGVAFEFRSKDENATWRSFWDGAIFFGSIIPAFLWGVTFANLIKGVPIDANMDYIGGFWNLLNPYALLAGLISLVGFVLHGAVFLSLKTSRNLADESRRIAMRLWLPELVLLVAAAVFSYVTRMLPIIFMVLSIAALVVSGLLLRVKRQGLAFLFTTLTVLLVTATLFIGLYPNVMVSSLNPAYSLTVINASSGQTTLRTMSLVAVVFVPIVLAYQAWSYWIFRKRVSEKAEGLEY